MGMSRSQISHGIVQSEADAAAEAAEADVDAAVACVTSPSLVRHHRHRDGSPWADEAAAMQRCD